MMEEKLRRYFENGVKKGFNVSYLKKQLKSHGHNASAVDMVAEEFMSEHAPVKRIEVVKNERSSKPLVWALGFVIVVLFVYLIVQASKPPVVGPADCEPIVKTVEVDVCKGQFDKQAAQAKLDDLSTLSIDINKKQAEIDRQINTISVLNASVEEKEKIIQEQVTQLQEVSEQIKEERSRIKQLLIQLLKSIIER